MGNAASKPLTKKICGGWGGSGRNSQPHRRGLWKDPPGPRMYTNPPTQESTPEAPNCLWVGEEVTKNWQRAEQAALFPLGPLPHIQHHNAMRVALPWRNLRFCSLQCTGCAETKKYGPNERRGENSRKITKSQRYSQPIRCTVQNTGNQEAHRTGWIWSQIRWKNEGYTKWKCTGNQ